MLWEEIWQQKPFLILLYTIPEVEQSKTVRTEQLYGVGDDNNKTTFM